jgi:hypothetical protein
MKELHSFYYDKKLDDSFITIPYQLGAVGGLIEYLTEKGFEYVDENYLIRYMFLCPDEIQNAYNELIPRIDVALQEKKDILPLKSVASWSDGEGEIKMSFDLCFDYEKHKCYFRLVP